MATSLQWPLHSLTSHFSSLFLLPDRSIWSLFLWSRDWCQQQPHEISNMETIFSPSPGNHTPYTNISPPLAVNTEINSHSTVIYLRVPLTIKKASWNHTMSFKIKWILNFGEICLNSLWGKKKFKRKILNCGRFGNGNRKPGDLFSIHKSPHHPRELECLSGYLFIMARAHVSREGGWPSG